MGVFLYQYDLQCWSVCTNNDHCDDGLFLPGFELFGVSRRCRKLLQTLSSAARANDIRILSLVAVQSPLWLSELEALRNLLIQEPPVQALTGKGRHQQDSLVRLGPDVGVVFDS